MGLVPDDEGNVGRDFSRDLITLLGEGDFGTSLPALLDGDAQDLLVLAFLAEAIEEIDGEEIADDILSRLEGWLSRHRSA